VCKVTGVAAGNVVTADSVKGIAEGMIVDFCSGVGVILAGAKGRTIKSVNRADKTFVVDGSALTSTIVPANSLVCLQHSGGLEITGLEALFSDSETLYGVNRASNPWMKPYEQTEVGTITESVLQKAIDTIEENSGSKVNFIVCSWGVRRSLADYYTQYRTFIPTLEITGGYKAMSFNGIPVVADRFCPEGTMYLLNTEDFCLHQLCRLVVAGGRRRKDTQTDRRKARLYRHACEICRAGVRAALRTGQVDGNRGILIA